MIGSSSVAVRWRVQDGLGLITFDLSGSKVNLISSTVWKELAEALDDLDRPDVRGVILSSGKANGFCAGADMRWLAGLAADPGCRETIEYAHGVVGRMLGYRRPIVAALDGAALGGGFEVALACHGRVGADAENTRIGLPEITLGLIPGGGGTQLLPRIVGPSTALTLMLSGRILGAGDAYELGLLDDLAPPTRLVEAARDLVVELTETGWTDKRLGVLPPSDYDLLLAGLPPANSAAAAEAIVDSVRIGAEAGFEVGFRMEADWFEKLLGSDEAQSRLEQFMAERMSAKGK